MRKRSIFSTVAASWLALVLFSTSAPSCGCEEPWMDFLASLGVQDFTDHSKLDGQVITEEANRHLMGKPLHHIDFPKETQPSSCVARTERLFNCEFWFIRGPVREHGFQVVLEADVQGRVTSARVTDLHRWFGFRV